mgnify:CR=1 FL=1
MMDRKEQRDKSLAEANRRRIARADDRKTMAKMSTKDCIAYFCTILKERPLHWQNASVSELLAILPGVSKTRSKKICDFQIDLETRIKNLSIPTASRLSMRVGALAPAWIDGNRRAKKRYGKSNKG